MEGLRLDSGAISDSVLDFDGNILTVTTPHYYLDTRTNKVIEIPGHYVDQNPEEFFGEDSCYKLADGSKESAFRHYRDVSGYQDHRGFSGLREDVELALEEGKFAPSMHALKNIFLVKGRFITILTARGNNPDSFQEALQLISSELLTEAEKDEQLSCIANNFNLSGMSDIDILSYYFSEVCDYIPCDNPQVKKFLSLESESGAVRKTQAMSWHLKQTHKKLGNIGAKFGKTISEIITPESPLAIGFSDDSVGNVVEMGKWMKNSLPKNHRGSLFFTGQEENRETVQELLLGVGKSSLIMQGENEMLKISI